MHLNHCKRGAQINFLRKNPLPFKPFYFNSQKKEKKNQWLYKIHINHKKKKK